MRITESRIRRIIREEAQRVLREGDSWEIGKIRWEDGEGRREHGMEVIAMGTNEGEHTFKYTIWRDPKEGMEGMYHLERELPSGKSYPVGERTTLSRVKELAESDLEKMLRDKRDPQWVRMGRGERD